MTNPPRASRQDNATYIAASIDRRMKTTEEMTPSVHQVEALHGLRKSMDDLRALPDFCPAWVAETDLRIRRVAEQCQLSGHVQEYADLSRPRRRSLQKLVEGSW